MIDVNESTQIERTCQRDTQTKEQVQAIINAQMTRKERLKQADDIIDNSGSTLELQQQIEKIHHHYLSLLS